MATSLGKHFDTCILHVYQCIMGLGINRRRIYDIINVMEALEMISKQSKNWYLWHGRGNLLHTLAKLKVSFSIIYSFVFIILINFLLLFSGNGC